MTTTIPTTLQRAENQRQPHAEAETIETGDLPTDLPPPIKQLCENALNKYFEEAPAETVSGDGIRTNLAKAHSNDVTVGDGNLLAEFGI